MTSFFEENFENVCTITKFSTCALGIFMAERERKRQHFWKTKSGLGLEGTGDYGMMKYITKDRTGKNVEGKKICTKF